MTDLLNDARRSGVYRAPRASDILAAARAHGFRVARVARGGKPALLRGFAAALEFPDWFGGNWDALEDCLTDLSWVPAPGYLVLIGGTGTLAGDDFSALREILESVARFWSARGVPFYAVFLSGPRTLPEFVGATAA